MSLMRKWVNWQTSVGGQRESKRDYESTARVGGERETGGLVVVVVGGLATEQKHLCE